MESNRVFLGTAVRTTKLTPPFGSARLGTGFGEWPQSGHQTLPPLKSAVTQSHSDVRPSQTPETPSAPAGLTATPHLTMTRRTISVLRVSTYLGFSPHVCEFLVRDTSGSCHPSHSLWYQGPGRLSKEEVCSR